MHAISSYRGITDPLFTHTHAPTNRQDRLQYTGPQLARSVTTSLAVVNIAEIRFKRIRLCRSVDVGPTGGGDQRWRELYGFLVKDIARLIEQDCTVRCIGGGGEGDGPGVT